MEELKELIKIVSKVKVQQIEIIGHDASNKSVKSQALYDGIASSQFDTDEEAALAIYGPNYKKDTYRKLKKHLENKLLNTLFFIDVSEEDESTFIQNYRQACKLLVYARLIRTTPFRVLGNRLFKKTLKIGLEFGFSDIIIEASTFLKNYAMSYLRDYKKADYYGKILKRYYKIKGFEIFSQDACFYLERKLTVKTVISKEILEELNKRSRHLQRIIQNYHSSELLTNASSVILNTHQLNQEYDKQLKEGINLIRFLKQNPCYARPRLIRNIYISNMEAALILKNFKVGKEMASLFFHSYRQESLDKYSAKEIYILICLHTKHWNEAYQFYYTNIDSKYLKKLDSKKEERFNIIRAYLYFLYLIKKIIVNETPKKQFRLHKFLNEVPHYSQDKRGINIPILVVQILILLAQNKKVAILDKQEALQQYSWRYLRNDQTLRSNCFIKMLGCMTKSNFHKNATIRTSKKYYEKLIANPARNYLNAHFREIIPYEDQWELILELLENKAR